MSPEKVIYSLLNDNDWASDDWWILGGVQVYTQTRPESDPLPAVVISKISDVPVSRLNALAGANKYRARISCLCMGDTPEAAKRSAEACVDACLFETGTIGGVNVDRVRLDAFGPDSYDQMTNTYMQPVDFIVTYDL